MPKIEISPDYYSNHIEKIKWPYSIYHQPIEDQINKELIQQSHQSSQPIKALNLGCGLFNDYPQKKQMAQWSASDLDPRCIHALKEIYPDLDTFVCSTIPDLPLSFYDFIMAKEVIEHILEPGKWCQALFSALKPGGRLVLSTPNYGFSLLPLIEYSVLEIIARQKGFSRFDIHPTKFTSKKLHQLLRQYSPPSGSVRIQKISWGMALFATVELK